MQRTSGEGLSGLRRKHDGQSRPGWKPLKQTALRTTKRMRATRGPRPRRNRPDIPLPDPRASPPQRRRPAKQQSRPNELCVICETTKMCFGLCAVATCGEEGSYGDLWRGEEEAVGEPQEDGGGREGGGYCGGHEGSGVPQISAGDRVLRRRWLYLIRLAMTTMSVLDRFDTMHSTTILWTEAPDYRPDGSRCTGQHLRAKLGNEDRTRPLQT